MSLKRTIETPLVNDENPMQMKANIQEQIN
jgi:hypothetical protein